MKQFRQERYFFKKRNDIGEKLDDEETLRKTEEFNVSLRENPHDINLWLEYVRFQDVVINETKPRAEKKMAILEKAMGSNPNSLKLTEEMFSVMDTYSTPDSIQHEAKKMILKDNKNTVAWQWMINSVLLNITKLSVPNVLETFSLALDALFKAFPNNSQPLLDVLLECSVFLRQSGLWEQLWMLIQLSLELNLSTPGSNAFRISTKINEDKLRETEDEIIVSGLPLGSLWLRLEYLRSCFHYLPVASSEDDPQRVVFSSDVASLLHPVHSSHTPRLISILLTSIKVPLMPMSDSAVKFVGINKVTWSIESPEFLLAALTHPYLMSQADSSCLTVSKELIVSPQCIIQDRPGCEEFFHSSDVLFDRIISALSNDPVTRDLIALWKMRWYRLLGNRSKPAMELLKGFPQNIPLFTEYALLCYSSNDTAMCFKVFERSIKHAGASPILHLPKEREKKALAYLYKIYIELLVRIDVKQHRDKIMRILVKLATGATVNDETLNAGTRLCKVKQKFESVSKEMVLDISTESPYRNDATLEDVMIPSFQVSWLSCYAWFLYIIECPSAAQRHMEWVCCELTKGLESSTLSLRSVVLEGCYETLITVMHSACRSSLPDCYHALRTVLQKAASLYPNNLFFLHVASSIDVLTGRWWSVSSVFLNHNASVFIKLFTIFVYRQKMFQFQTTLSEDERLASGKKLYSLVRRVVAEGEGELKRCPLLWRLLLQFVAAQHPAEIKSSFFRALDLCPWVKSIYYDGAKMLPEELGHIQDLIVEKELRIYITSEELEILRQDGVAPNIPDSGS